MNPDTKQITLETPAFMRPSTRFVWFIAAYVVAMSVSAYFVMQVCSEDARAVMEGQV